MRAGKRLSEALRGSLHAVHAYARFPVNCPPEVLVPGMTETLQKDAERAAKARFSRVLRPARIAHSRQYLIAREPVEAIAEAARKSHSAIVVMGAMSRSGIKRLLIGNTAERILDDLSCDILIVKPVNFRVRFPGLARRALAARCTGGGVGRHVQLLLIIPHCRQTGLLSRLSRVASLFRHWLTHFIPGQRQADIDYLFAAKQERVGLESDVAIARILRADRRFDRPTVLRVSCIKKVPVTAVVYPCSGSAISRYWMESGFFRCPRKYFLIASL